MKRSHLFLPRLTPSPLWILSLLSFGLSPAAVPFLSWIFNLSLNPQMSCTFPYLRKVLSNSLPFRASLLCLSFPTKLSNSTMGWFAPLPHASVTLELTTTSLCFIHPTDSALQSHQWPSDANQRTSQCLPAFPFLTDICCFLGFCETRLHCLFSYL